MRQAPHSPAPHQRQQAESHPPKPSSPQWTAQQVDAATKIQAFYRANQPRRKALASIASVGARFDTLKSDFLFPSVVDYIVDGDTVHVTPPTSLQPTAVASDHAETETENTPRLAYTHNNTPLHAYTEQLNRLLISLDGVESGGDVAVREKRKEMVRRVEGEAERLDRWRREVWRAHVRAQNAPQQLESLTQTVPATPMVEDAPEMIPAPASSEVASSPDLDVMPALPDPAPSTSSLSPLPTPPMASATSFTAGDALPTLLTVDHALSDSTPPTQPSHPTTVETAAPYSAALLPLSAADHVAPEEVVAAIPRLEGAVDNAVPPGTHMRVPEEMPSEEERVLAGREAHTAVAADVTNMADRNPDAELPMGGARVVEMGEFPQTVREREADARRDEEAELEAAVRGEVGSGGAEERGEGAVVWEDVPVPGLMAVDGDRESVKSGESEGDELRTPTDTERRPLEDIVAAGSSKAAEPEAAGSDFVVV
jgi:hypothetical protein